MPTNDPNRSRSAGAECMARLACLVFLLPALLSAQTDEYPTAQGPIRITPFVGASVQIEYQGAVIHVDPWSRADYESARPADLVLVTDTPADHLDPALIEILRQPTATVILPSTAADARDEGGATRVRAVPGAVVMSNGEQMSVVLASGGTPVVAVEAVAMYDLIPGAPFHARGEGNGYVLTLGGVRIYLSGVTECTPEMRAVEDVDVLFVPMNLPNGRMPPDAAAECAKLLAPDVVYPYHYREQPIDAFVEALSGGPIEIRLHDWYPPA
jgi:L-ascorbate metabolism protein UlaG (beta-lactamase superfamily)